jgi:6,7-dimethyl-8-ribityllumazine synthase
VKRESDATELPRIDGATVAIVQSKWHADLTDRMVEKCAAVLEQQGAAWEHHVLPGTLEVPLACQGLARTGRYDAIVCIGAIVKGDTWHFEMVLDLATRSLGQIMLNEDVPILIEIIPATSMDQVIARTGDDEFNKGIEAAVAACETISWRRMALAS